MIYGEIFRQRLQLTGEYAAADTIDYLEMKFFFRTDDWDGLEKWAHFADEGGNVYDICLTDDCIRKEDHLNLSAGMWKVYLHGNEFKNGKVVKRITTGTAVFEVQPTGTLDGEPFPEMPAGVTEQILARLENVEQNGGGGSGGMWYGTTSSGERESIKAVTTVSGDFRLEKGSQVSVKFLTNSEYCQALNVDGTGVVYIHETYVDGAEDLPAGTAPNLWHNLGQINTFIYDGKYFIVEDGVRATADNHLFGKVGVSDSVTLDSGDYVASSRAAKRAYDKAVEALEIASSGGGGGSTPDLRNVVEYPTGAKAGDLIAVASVDENGVPETSKAVTVKEIAEAAAKEVPEAGEDAAGLITLSAIRRIAEEETAKLDAALAEAIGSGVIE